LRPFQDSSITMIVVLITLHLMIVLAMIGVVLLQKSEGGGLGIGSTGGFLSSRGTANALTRMTAFLAMAFFATSLLLSWIASLERRPSSMFNSGTPPAQSAPGPSQGGNPGQGGGGLLDRLRGPAQQQGAPQPAAPQGAPQVPQSQ
jgi:preprotein translocase subunit SecG